MALELDRLLATCTMNHASELLLAPGVAPLVRIEGALREMQTDVPDRAAIEAAIAPALPDGTRQRLDQAGYADFDFRWGEDETFGITIVKDAAGGWLVLIRPRADGASQTQGS